MQYSWTVVRVLSLACRHPTSHYANTHTAWRAHFLIYFLLSLFPLIPPPPQQGPSLGSAVGRAHTLLWMSAGQAHTLPWGSGIEPMVCCRPSPHSTVDVSLYTTTNPIMKAPSSQLIQPHCTPKPSPSKSISPGVRASARCF